MTTPNRAFGLDYAWGDLTPQEVLRAGATFVCGYLSHTPAKNLTPDEVRGYSAHGIATVCVWETSAKRMLAGYDAGHKDAVEANIQARRIGKPPKAPVFYAADWDASPQEQYAINQYLEAASHVGPAGVYGSYYVCKRAHGVLPELYLWQTYAWSGGQWLPAARLRQYSNGHVVGGVSVDYNHGLTNDFGQWRIRGRKPKNPPHIPPRPAGYPAYPGIVIHEGMHGSTVKLIQHRLNELVDAKLRLDGIFGANTKHSVQVFQGKRHLVEDGIVGPKTWKGLFG